MRFRRFWSALSSLRLPLHVTRSAGDFFPLIAEQNFKILHVPLVRCWRPSAFKAGRRGVIAFTGAM